MDDLRLYCIGAFSICGSGVKTSGVGRARSSLGLIVKYWPQGNLFAVRSFSTTSYRGRRKKFLYFLCKGSRKKFSNLVARVHQGCLLNLEETFSRYFLRKKYSQKL